MPCAVDSRYEDNEELRFLTRAACDMAKVITTPGGKFDDLQPATKAWIRKHDEEDAIQKEAEKAYDVAQAKRRQVIEKLDLEDRKILGLG